MRLLRVPAVLLAQLRLPPELLGVEVGQLHRAIVAAVERQRRSAVHHPVFAVVLLSQPDQGGGRTFAVGGLHGLAVFGAVDGGHRELVTERGVLGRETDGLGQRAARRRVVPRELGHFRFVAKQR